MAESCWSSQPIRGMPDMFDRQNLVVAAERVSLLPADQLPAWLRLGLAENDLLWLHII